MGGGMAMRNLICILLAVCFCGFAIYASAETGTVTASALVLREGPGLEYAMLGEIPGGAVLELKTYENGWFHVAYDGRYGYVSARYIQVALPGEGNAQPEGNGYAPYPEATVAPPVYESGGANGAAPDLSLPKLVFDEENNPNYPKVMKPGDMGNSVIDLQKTLQQFGYSVQADGQYGYDTQAAVMKLQLSMGIDADGIVGAQTRRLVGNKGAGGMELLDWWLGGNVAYARLTEASLVDVRTGTRFKISRYGGDNHCDTEPLTAQDTAAMLAMLGGEWTWERRPVWLEVGGRVIAASMNCMPHEGQHIMDNNFNGHFCLHFYNSRTHDTDRIDEAHAACVQEAWAKRESYSP